jgi:hypothetical protein
MVGKVNFALFLECECGLSYDSFYLHLFIQRVYTEY